MEYINEHMNKMISFEDMELLDMEKVISALSFYLNYNTKNYHYNHAFLPSNFKDFQESVKSLQHKNTIYEDISVFLYASQ